MPSALSHPSSPEAAGLPTPRQGKEAAARVSILIVDDQPNLVRVTAVALRLLGCQVFTAATVADALQQLDAEMIDALFLDVNLGGESGWELLSQLMARSHRTPVIVFTAKTENEIAAEAIRRGALGCLFKPFTLDDLRRQITLVRQHLRKHPGRANRQE